MLTLHHLRIGRSLYALWLLEELGVDYQLKTYVRDANMRAPEELKTIHSLGKSPVIDDDGLIVAESGAITTYLLERYDAANKFSPPPSELQQWAKYSQWLHYPEASVFMPIFMQVLVARDPSKCELISGFCQAEAKLHLDYISESLADQSYILGEELSGADFGMAFVLALAEQLNLLTSYPNLVDYLARIRARPAFLIALEKGIE